MTPETRTATRATPPQATADSEMSHTVRFTGLAVFVLASWGVVGGLLAGAAEPNAAPGARPNVLWITCEDMSPDLGCYGSTYSVSPHLDRLAAQGCRYTRCFTHIGVCAPSRSGIVTGMYPPSMGTQHMRSSGIPQAAVRAFPEYLRAQGYYCTNNSKTDYNFLVPPGAWDESSEKAHWRNRRPGQPFFAVVNLTVTHESQIRAPEGQYQKNTAGLRPEDRHDPARATLPPYYPDTPVVRRDWARYHDNITAMDLQVAELLAELDAAGLADETVVFFYSDHGRGLPRGKRWLYDASLHVPLIVRWPGKLEPGSVSDELVAFVDLAPTVLSICGVPLPKHLQGQAFLGPAKATAPREYIYGCRDRMDERYDLIRAVRDARYKYIKNYQPWRPYAQRIAYMDEMPTMQELRRLDAEGKLPPAAALFMAPTKPAEELYDTQADPHEIRNLAGDPAHAAILDRMRAAHRRWAEEVHDLGLVPEPLMTERMRPEGRAPATAPPQLAVRGTVRDGGWSVALRLPTPGASLQYRLLGAGRDSDTWWVLKGPLTIRPGFTLEARASRIGYTMSGVQRWSYDDLAAAPVGPAGTSSEVDAPAADWQSTFDLEPLWALQAVLDRGAAAIDELPAWTERTDPAVRYRAVEALGVYGRGHDAALGAVRARLADEHPAVRAAAAEALVRLGHADEALPVLIASLREPAAGVRLVAMLALDELGEGARPALDAVREAMRTHVRGTSEGEYVLRVGESVLKKLDGSAATESKPARRKVKP